MGGRSPRSYSFSFSVDFEVSNPPAGASGVLDPHTTGAIRRPRGTTAKWNTLAAFARRRMSFAKSLVAFFIIQKIINTLISTHSGTCHLFRPADATPPCSARHTPAHSRDTCRSHTWPVDTRQGLSLLLRPCSCRTAYGRPSSASDRQPRCPCVARWRACAPQCTALHFPNICRSHGAIAGNRAGTPDMGRPLYLPCGHGAGVCQPPHSQ